MSGRRGKREEGNVEKERNIPPPPPPTPFLPSFYAPTTFGKGKNCRLLPLPRPKEKGKRKPRGVFFFGSLFYLCSAISNVGSRYRARGEMRKEGKPLKHSFPSRFFLLFFLSTLVPPETLMRIPTYERKIERENHSQTP